MEAAEMNPKREKFLLIASCGLVVLLSVAGIVSAVLTGLIWDLDGLTLLLSCLTIGGLFSLFLFFLVRSAGWLPGRKSSGSSCSSGDSGGPSTEK